MAPQRVCSECGASLAGKDHRQKTCSNKCRLARSRRQRRANQEFEDLGEAANEGGRTIAQIVRTEATDVVSRVLKDQLQPIVREALTEDVLRAISDLVGLTPRAVQAMTEDLESDNEILRQRAYTLLIKYTVGHPAIVKAEDAAAGQQMVVNFNLPRPDDLVDNTAVIADSEELRLCDMCETEKPTSEFVAESPRCQACFADWRDKVLAEFS